MIVTVGPQRFGHGEGSPVHLLVAVAGSRRARVHRRSS